MFFRDGQGELLWWFMCIVNSQIDWWIAPRACGDFDGYRGLGAVMKYWVVYAKCGSRFAVAVFCPVFSCCPGAGM